MKKILFLTTGGTIACTVTDEGLEPTLKGEDILKQVPELRTLGAAIWNRPTGAPGPG